jgi:hypothetical protein
MPRPSRILPFAILLLVAAAACTERDRTTDAPTPADERLAAEYQEIVGRLKLVKEEYVDAVRDGEIIDAQEYEEAEMFAEQAALRFRAVAAHARAKDPATAERISKGLGDLVAVITSRGPVEDEETLVRSLLEDVASVSPRPVPPAVEGTRAAVAKADAQIESERIVEGYRIGLLFSEPRTTWLRREDGTLRRSAPTAESNRFVAIVLREQRTKRFLPAAGVRARIGDGEPVDLPHLWGEFPLYGANLRVPDGSFEVAIEISPPAVHRHGDMLATFVKPAATRFSVRADGGRLRAAGDRPSPVADDYAVGDDVLQAIGEALWKGEAGPYRLGFIAEAPEPIWLWEGGAPRLRTASANETHHLEIAVMEKATMRMVPEAAVTLRLESEDASPDTPPLEFPLHPLLSEFLHYGNTVAVPPGRYRVTVRVEPPRFGALAPGVFEDAVEATFSWDRTGSARADAAEGAAR